MASKKENAIITSNNAVMTSISDKNASTIYCGASNNDVKTFALPS